MSFASRIPNSITLQITSFPTPVNSEWVDAPPEGHSARLSANMCIYIYIYIERERDICCIHIYIYIYIYIYTISIYIEIYLFYIRRSVRQTSTRTGRSRAAVATEGGCPPMHGNYYIMKSNHTCSMVTIICLIVIYKNTIDNKPI